MTLPCRPALALACLTLIGAPAAAQWTADPAANTPVSTAASDQSQPKVAPAEGGGAWVSWFDGIGSGWDVRVQRLDIGGVATLGTGGVLVADRAFSSTQDYGLSTSADGGALLAYRDDDGAGTFVAANKVAPDGSLPWGPNGVTLSGTTGFVAAPAVAGTADGRALVAYTLDDRVVLRRLDADGNIVGGLALTPASGTYSVCDMHAAGDDVIVSFVHQTGGFGSPRRLLAQKIDASDGLAWGAAHVALFTSGSLQFGNFPDFLPDGTGGAVFSWYDAGSLQLQCYVQRLLADGTAAFPAGGQPVSSDATRVRVSPWATFDAATGETTVTWTELTSNQAQSGAYAQRLDVAGNRLWGSFGAEIVPVGADSITSVLHVPLADRTLVTWDRSPAFGQDVIGGARLDDSGAVDGAAFDVSSLPAVKSRLTVSSTGAGHAVLAWADDRTDGGDIYAQNVNGDGSLGPRWSDLGGGTAGVDGVPVLTCSGPLTAGSELGVSLARVQPGGLALLWASFASVPVSFFGGTIHALPPAVEILVAVDGDGEFAIDTPFPAGVPAGVELTVQFLCQDGGSPFGKTLTDAQQGTTP